MSFSDLPILFDLSQPHSCADTKCFSTCICYKVAVHEKPQPLEPDKRLVNWEEWMTRRKSAHRRLGEQMEREPGDLVMNSGEEYRAVKEEKVAFEYTRIQEPDPERGCPSFWQLPPSLKNNCGDGTYFSVEKKEDRCEVPVIEHVGLSSSVLQEKNVLPRKRNSKVLWKNLPYVQAKFLELADKLEKIVPHKPDFSDLFIKGTAFGKIDVADLVELQKEQSLHSSKDYEKPDAASTQTKSTLGLKINDLYLNPGLEMSGTRKVYVLFDYDKSDGSLATEHITLSNLGSCSVHFSWRPSPKHSFFKNIIADTTCQVYFYFNKNDWVILPGETIEFPIWFRTKEQGTYYEQWEIYTRPSVAPPNTSVLVILYATAMFSDIDEKVEIIRERLEKSIRDRFLSEMLSNITSNIPENKFKPIVYTYNKKEVFESINSSFDPVNRDPKYVYDIDVVKELQKFYKKVRQPTDPKTWNYHIEELKLLTRAKQRQEELLRADLKHEESKRIYAARPKRQELPVSKASYSKTEVSKHETPSSSQNVKTPDVKDDAFQDSMSLTEELNVILSKLKSTGGHQNVEQVKYDKAYHIFCTYINKIENEIEDLKNRLGIIKRTSYPKISIDLTSQFYCKPTRLVYEELDEILQRPPLLWRDDTSADKPAAEILIDIPMNESKRRFKTYYGLPDSPVEGSSKKKKKSNKPGSKSNKSKKPASKSTKKESKSSKKEKKKADLDEDDKYVVNEKFDPYIKIELPDLTLQPIKDVEEEVDNSIVSNLHQVSETVLCQYKYTLYVIVYTYLDEAVTNIIDMIEMQPKENLPHTVIREFEEPRYTRRLIDLKSIIAEEDAESIKAKLVLWKYRKDCKKDWKSIEIQRQIRNVKSDSSLWSILRPQEGQLRLPEEKPISYPIDHYGDTNRKEHLLAVDKVNISTSTLEGGVLDDTWEDYKEVSQQKEYDAEDQEDDLEEYVEKVVSETSAGTLDDDGKIDKATQKRSFQHVSDEEHFYDSDTDIDKTFISESEKTLSCGVCDENSTSSSNKRFN